VIEHDRATSRARYKKQIQDEGDSYPVEKTILPEISFKPTRTTGPDLDIETTATTTIVLHDGVSIIVCARYSWE